MFSQSDSSRVPLFPLNALIAPKGRIPLRIFEARYLDMVSSCLKNGRGFVVVLIKRGPEAGFGTPDFYRYGTLVNIVDFDKSENGVLDITVEGQQRVQIRSPERNEQGLWLGDIEAQIEEDFVPLPSEYRELSDVLKALVQHPLVQGLGLNIDFQDGREVAWRLTELLPLENGEKQTLFEMDSALHRLESLSKQLDAMAL